MKFYILQLFTVIIVYVINIQGGLLCITQYFVYLNTSTVKITLYSAYFKYKTPS